MISLKSVTQPSGKGMGHGSSTAPDQQQPPKQGSLGTEETKPKPQEEHKEPARIAGEVEERKERPASRVECDSTQRWLKRRQEWLSQRTAKPTVKLQRPGKKYTELEKYEIMQILDSVQPPYKTFKEPINLADLMRILDESWEELFDQD